MLLYFKYCQTYLNTSASNRTYKKTKKKEKNRKKRNTRNKISDGEPIAICTTKRHVSYAKKKRQYTKYF